MPVAIHLWNRRPGQVVPVGALRWLTPGANRRVSRLQLSQKTLLALRLLILGLLVAALAGPQWSTPAPPARPQVLLSAGVMQPSIVEALRPSLDSLRRQGAQFRLLATGFPLLPDSAFSETALTNGSPARNEHAAYWPLAVQAVGQFPGSELRIISDNAQQHFRGTRPALPPRLRWQLLPAATDSGAWLHSAARITPDSLRLLTGYDRTGNSVFRAHRLPLPAAGKSLAPVSGLPPLTLVTESGHLSIRVGRAADSAAYQVPVLQPLRVAVYFDAQTRAADSRAVAAALRAAAPYVPASLQLHVTSTPPASSDSLDWLFWLSDTPAPAVWRQRAATGLRLFTDAKGSGTTSESLVFTLDGTTFQLRQRHDLPALPSSMPLWADGTGQAVLDFERVGRGGIYRLHTRLHPAWSSLATDGQLPAALLTLLTPELASGPDRRALAASQLRSTTAASEQLRQPAAQVLGLGPWLVLLAGLLFGLERIWRHRTLPSPSPA